MKVTPSSIVRDLILTILTLGLWNLYVQFRQINDYNDLVDQKRQVTSFIWMVILTLLTLGLYFCYHEYSLTKKLHLLLYQDTNPVLEIAMAFLSFTGLWIIVDSYQQSLINKHLYRSTGNS